MRTRVKICGITLPEDALNAVEQGADAIGLVFYPPSPRYVSVQRAREIVLRLPPFVTVVGLFVDADRETIRHAVHHARIDLIQFHGSETAEYCASHDRSWIKAVRMKDEVDLPQLSAEYAGASALLLDAYRPGLPGGTGDTFDWGRIPPQLAGKIILAGGLNPENVSEAVRKVKPYAVDVSGGVEASKGIKDAAKVAQFIRGVSVGEQ